jgi:hypothetical protein
MMMLRSATAGVIATAMLATSVTPAMAQGYPGGGYGGYGGGYGRDRHDHHDRIGVGEVIAGVAILGVIAAIASSGSKRNRGYQDGYRGSINSEQQAADGCAASAERQGARVTGIDTVDRTSDGYRVRGTISTRDGGNYGYGRNAEQRFSCAVRYGAVEDIRIDNNGNYGYGNRGY